jgi:hypothetical protein
MNIYSYLPNRKVLSSIVLKVILGIAAGSLCFAVLTVLYNLFLALYIGHTTDLLPTLGLVALVTIIWSLVFASIPVILGAILLLILIYQDFRAGKMSKRLSITKGAALGGLLGISAALYVLFTAFRSTDQIAFAPYVIPAATVALLVGAWGGTQIFNELSKLTQRDVRL